MTKKEITTATSTISAILSEVSKVVIGQEKLVRNLLIALIARGHILLEGVPGLAKTLAIETLAKTVWLDFNRLQFTPDLLPSDLIGTRIFNPQTNNFEVKKGPIFAHLILADEINRAPAKVQSALLEAMAEQQVTIGEQMFELDHPFTIMATQNPLEQEGTYSLPEAQLDRFLLKTVITYPSEEEELQIMKNMTDGTLPDINAQANQKEILELQVIADQIHVAESIYEYVKNIVFATRSPDKIDDKQLASWIQFGVSPRASISLIQAAKVIALMNEREYVIPEDIKDIAHDVMRHRLILSFNALADGINANEVITRVLEKVAVVEEK